MAHFAELKTKVDPTGFTSDEHQVVERVVVVANDEVPSDMHVAVSYTHLTLPTKA